MYVVIDIIQRYVLPTLINDSHASPNIDDGLNCFAHKIGGRNGVLNWHKTFSKLHPETAHELYIVVLEREKISADDACTMFNAVVNNPRPR